MTVAVSCNLSDGVILGVDSAVTVPSPSGDGIVKVYENAEKLFQLGDKPIGVAIYGIAGFAQRGIGSFIREFELKDPEGVVTNKSALSAVVEELRKFFYNVYASTVIPAIEEEIKDDFGKLPDDKVPIFGLVIGGFPCDSYLSEVWNVKIPFHDTPNSSTMCRKQGDFGTNWFAAFDPIRRYIKGYDPQLLNAVLSKIVEITSRPFSKTEMEAIQQTLSDFEYQIPFDAMPVEEGIAHTKFLVDLAIGHYRYSVGAPIVGGKAKIGKVTYRGEHFEILDSNTIGG